MQSNIAKIVKQTDYSIKKSVTELKTVQIKKI